MVYRINDFWQGIDDFVISGNPLFQQGSQARDGIVSALMKSPDGHEDLIPDAVTCREDVEEFANKYFDEHHYRELAWETREKSLLQIYKIKRNAKTKTGQFVIQFRWRTHGSEYDHRIYRYQVNARGVVELKHQDSKIPWQGWWGYRYDENNFIV